jgi:hypothetical protein
MTRRRRTRARTRRRRRRARRGHGCTADHDVSTWNNHDRVFT